MLKKYPRTFIKHNKLIKDNKKKTAKLSLVITGLSGGLTVSEKIKLIKLVVKQKSNLCLLY
jgi:hypothetical protein